MYKTVTISILLLIIIVMGYAQADEYVRGYYRKNGTFVNPYVRTERDTSTENNYSTSGNYNPNTDRYGTQGQKYNYYIKKNKPQRITPPPTSYYNLNY